MIFDKYERISLGIENYLKIEHEGSTVFIGLYSPTVMNAREGAFSLEHEMTVSGKWDEQSIDTLLSNACKKFALKEGADKRLAGQIGKARPFAQREPYNGIVELTSPVPSYSYSEALRIHENLVGSLMEEAEKENILLSTIPREEGITLTSNSLHVKVACKADKEKFLRMEEWAPVIGAVSPNQPLLSKPDQYASFRQLAFWEGEMQNFPAIKRVRNLEGRKKAGWYVPTKPGVEYEPERRCLSINFMDSQSSAEEAVLIGTLCASLMDAPPRFNERGELRDAMIQSERYGLAVNGNEAFLELTGKCYIEGNQLRLLVRQGKFADVALESGFAKKVSPGKYVGELIKKIEPELNRRGLKTGYFRELNENQRFGTLTSRKILGKSDKEELIYKSSEHLQKNRRWIKD